MASPTYIQVPPSYGSQAHRVALRGSWSTDCGVFPNRTLLNHESARSGRLEPSTIIVRLVRRTHASCVLPLANRFRAIRMDSHALAKGRRQVFQGSPAWKSLA